MLVKKEAYDFYYYHNQVTIISYVPKNTMTNETATSPTQTPITLSYRLNR